MLKKDLCNIVPTWPRYMIALVITFNDILLKSPIALSYHFFLSDYIPNI